MVTRLAFVLVALFWVTMNVLLWKSEYGIGTRPGSPVPVELVWEKILSAPDDSSLNIIRRGKRIGFCRLQTDVGEELSKLEEAPQQGVKARNKIKIDGSVGIQDLFRRMRFECEMALSTHRNWEYVHARLVYRPLVMDIRSYVTNQTVRIHATDGDVNFERTVRLTEFKNPMSFLSEIGGPVISGLFGALELPQELSPDTSNQPFLKWEARNDTLTIGHEPVRVYRLQTDFMDRYNIVIYVSRAGEILKAELPEGVSLVHDKLASY
jgi:hypothetical protein